ncbi:hypothetical protein [Nocardioides sp. AE5]|uniref:hypothetical protein n=1 Tax=Nocardioides sp. AE5 TaxID=2962573 RepID=UPI002880F522|nr:hypothetical protein [Nocardioides sp. AE5]MDT0201050.1 hypothetical protein [Nocardioides sp. AE5]
MAPPYAGCLARRPDLVGAAVAQSASLWRSWPGEALAAAGPVRARLEVGRQEWVLLEPNRRLAAELTDAEAEVELVEFNGGHDYACWRGGLIDSIAALLTRTDESEVRRA